MYGLPAYDDIDPTPIVGITYTLLFELMFGDLGQGLLISLLGWVMWKWKKMNLGRIMIRIGFSSAVFGCIYGSVFGFENLLDQFIIAIGLSGNPLRLWPRRAPTLSSSAPWPWEPSSLWPPFSPILSWDSSSGILNVPFLGTTAWPA